MFDRSNTIRTRELRAQNLKVTTHRNQARVVALSGEAEQQFKASLVLMALIGSACIATTFAALVQIG